jgi:WD40 repeat protein/class 3 adenylate cyclase
LGTRSESDRDLKIPIAGFVADLVLETLRDQSGEVVDLRPQAFAVLRYLAENANRLISKDELMQAVWPGIAVTDDSLVQCVHEIRRALGDDRHTILKTVPRRGYRLVVPVTTAGAESQRRMAAILAADAVGYSQLMGKDEETTLASLKLYRSVIDTLVDRHHGRVFGSAGDSVVAEFASPVEAVNCATEIQLEIDKRNLELAEANRMRFRIGINLGDVIVDGDNLLGDGVNVAARLEALSPPGGICISEAIYTHVRDRLSLDFLDLGEHKVKNITRPLRAYRVPLASEEQLKSPFRGLEVFDFGHSNMFFGRSRAIAACIERLETLAGGHSAFLLIYGMSGSGKSSLLRAGLIPAIVRSGETAGISLWRRCVFRPSEESNPIAALVAGLLNESALPELADERTLAETTELLSAPERAPALIRAALAKAATAAGLTAPQARLVVAVDQMEELFTTQADRASREAFVRLLASLATSGMVWVIGTIRADFFHRCSEIPGLSALKDGLGNYELLPPSGPEIAQIIREPARAAGLRFEEAADFGHLEDVLQEAAAADPGSLPLLEFVLDALYETCRERRLLTFAAYRALGGLEGAIARRADEVVEALPPDVQDALPSVLRSLMTVRPGDEAVTTVPAKLSEVGGTPARSILVNALVAARLLVSDEDAEGIGVIRVAHEALLSRWPRAREIVHSNRSFLEVRARLQADARRWERDNKNPDLLLPPGKRLAEGEEVLGSRREDVDHHIIDYIEASSLAEKERSERKRQAERALIEAEEAAKRERLEREAERQSMQAAAATRLARRTRIAAVVALLLAIGAGVGAVIGLRGQQEAMRQARRAEENAAQARVAEAQSRRSETEALTARNEALRNQSLSLAFLSEQAADNGNSEAAVLLALEALPRDISAPDRPYSVEAEAALYSALSKYMQVAVLRHEAGVEHAEFSPAGDRVVTSSFDKTARVWNAEDGAEIAVLKGHQGDVETATFSPDGSRVLTAGFDNTARIWDAASGQQIFVLPQPGEVYTARFSGDGTRAFTASFIAPPTVWDAKTGGKIASLGSPRTSSVALSPDGRTFATALESNDIFLRNVDDGRELRKLSSPTYPEFVALSPDASQILVVPWQGSSYLLDASAGSQVAALAGHKSDTRSGTFSHDGRLVATVSLEGATRVYFAATGRFYRTLGEEEEGLNALSFRKRGRYQNVNGSFSPDDRLFATASMHGISRIWNVETGALEAVLRGHSGSIEHVEFSPEGGRLVTASHDSTARLWDIDGVLRAKLRHDRPPIFAAFSPDGMRIVTLAGGYVATIWDASSGRELGQFEDQSGGPLRYAAFSPDGRTMATASQNGRVVLWDVASGHEHERFTASGSSVVRLQFSPDGAVLLVTSANNKALLLDVAGGKQLMELKQDSAVREALFSADGQHILTTSMDGAAVFWRSDGTKVRSISEPQGRIGAAAISPDDRSVATGYANSTIQIWSVQGDNPPVTLTGHRGPILDVAFSPDGRFLISASRDGAARVWNVAGAEQMVLDSGEGAVTEAVFSPNGRYALTVSPQSRAVRLWSVDSGRVIARLAGDPIAKGAPAVTGASFSSDGTRVVVFSGEKFAETFRVFPTTQDLIAYARHIVPRELTPCEREQFFLPVHTDEGECAQ